MRPNPATFLTSAPRLTAVIGCERDEVSSAADRLGIMPRVRCEGATFYNQAQADAIRIEVARQRSEVTGA